MADDESKGDPIQMLWLVLGGMAVLIFLWFASGAYKNADLGGVFLAPPAPVGPGGSYGPQPGTLNQNYTNTNQQSQ